MTTGRRVLVADDNEDIRRDVYRILGGPQRRAALGASAARLFPGESFDGLVEVAGDEAAFDVDVASSGEEALAIARASRSGENPIAVAFVDVRMPPGMDGARVARLLRDEDPDVEVVLITAYADRSLSELNAGARGSDRLLFLKKPYAREEVYQLALSLSEKRRHRRELRAARERLDAILAATSDGLVGLDIDKQVVFANPSARELLELDGDAGPEGEHGVGLWARLLAASPRALPGDGAIELELAGRWLELGDVSPAAGGGDVESVIAVRDVTRRKEVERLKDEFVQNTSHELRTPLVAIRGYLDLALDEKLGALAPGLRRGLDVARRASARLLDLIDALLELSRLEAQAIGGGRDTRLERARVVLPELIERVADATRPSAEAKSLALNVEVEPGAEEVLGDARTLEVALRNLLGNAVKFTSRGEIGVAARVHGERVALEVWDTGTGLPPGLDPRVLFERFRQGDGSMSRSQGGVGIGLSLVERILALHGATVEARNREGGGASFRFELERAAPGLVSNEAARPQLRRECSVLVVEPRGPAREFLELALRAAGHDVAAAASVEEAVALEGRSVSGWSLVLGSARALAELARRARTGLAPGTHRPLVAVIAEPGEDPRVIERASGAFAVLERPVAAKRAIEVAAAAAARGSRLETGEAA